MKIHIFLLRLRLLCRELWIIFRLEANETRIWQPKMVRVKNMCLSTTYRRDTFKYGSTASLFSLIWIYQAATRAAIERSRANRSGGTVTSTALQGYRVRVLYNRKRLSSHTAFTLVNMYYILCRASYIVYVESLERFRVSREMYRTRMRQHDRMILMMHVVRHVQLS